ncbi:hypothetical protein PVAP13_2KG514200 [Panicum virgatum]|uniref:Cysteine-rich transmembrane CYSTM domain-containing protein n=1 Tax=Panicum virgatum TaxID=38727 RepID=A0A8T0WAG1_PANVG|nr:hypothetical protein PVAP13_2KG514200 [Panicum virgatum]
MLHRNTSYRDGAQGEGPSSSPSAGRSPSASRVCGGPMTPPPPPPAAPPRDPPEPPAAKRGFVVDCVMAVCCCCLADEMIM